jgi:pimeloyl-ACP methyl ester carboxylesterase
MGLGMRGEVWKPQIEALVDQCQLLYFDNRGVGASEEVGATLTMDDMASDATRVLDAAGWQEDVHLVGVSMGGMISQHLALLHQDRFASLTLIATHAGGPRTWLPPAKGLLGFLRVHLGPQDKRTDAMAQLLYPESFIQSCDADALHRRMNLQMGTRPNPQTLRRQLGAIRRHDTRLRLGQLKLPTLIVKPERDILVDPKNSERLLAGIPHASMLRIADGGHGVTFQCAKVLNSRLLEHFGVESEREQRATSQ